MRCRTWSGFPTQRIQQVKSGSTRARLRHHSLSYGNFGRNILRTPSVADADFSLFKNFVVTEITTRSFRAEFFDIFNIQNYGALDSLIGDPAAGRIT